MATVKKFEDLEVWQIARQLAKVVYAETINGTFERDFELKGPIRKSSGSIMDNIAEGFERGGKTDFLLVV